VASRRQQHGVTAVVSTLTSRLRTFRGRLDTATALHASPTISNSTTQLRAVACCTFFCVRGWVICSRHVRITTYNQHVLCCRTLPRDLGSPLSYFLCLFFFFFFSHNLRALPAQPDLCARHQAIKTKIHTRNMRLGHHLNRISCLMLSTHAQCANVRGQMRKLSRTHAQNSCNKTYTIGTSKPSCDSHVCAHTKRRTCPTLRSAQFHSGRPYHDSGLR
jgi:hypothetical protein